ncbi:MULTISPECIES: T6SS immunity protein Tli4 family protein [Pseudomonas aeruginosa group]|uniref:T6SS immunity protein Tli4 family protein n=1 Tax=Pseudomonas aeruginosa group TaxID=136841 RepID=UPI000A92A70E|nr:MULTISPECIES: T6SS immunity protein Tli4 family protein [Pseudomonas aeruginosa group]MBG3907195.1 hypothetical protein [Pseudomonas aeruginosa]MBG4204099.1 hypothetical protein [Pseudomonas aeruginosa]MBG4279497.1 hypothetical protein [Pseudomonas aeruginosa]MBG6892615.1 hypothetical protein [Pseudomonas aeruginosa]MBM9935628.1 hypothetical protein [Pseudomonas aeruginosa]
MTRRKYLLHAAFLAIVIATVFCALRNWNNSKYDRIYPITELTQKMQTHCVGRLLIDLPEGSTWEPNASGAHLDGYLALSVTTGVTEAEYDALVERRWSEIEAEEKKSTWPAAQSAKRVSPLKNSTVFSYGFHENEGPDLDGMVHKDVFHDAEGYLWGDGTLFTLGPKLNGADVISGWLPRLHARKNDEVPSKPGLCLNGAFVESYYDLAGPSETVSWGFKLPKNLGLVVRHRKVWEPEQPMLERYREAESEFAGLVARELAKPGVIAGRKEYRADKRNVNGLEGDERVVGGTEGRSARNYFKTNVGGEWNFPGIGSANPMPSINIDLGTTFQTTTRPAELGGFPSHDEALGYPTEAEFFELWDAILNSIRYRPGALTPSPPGSSLTIRSSPVRSASLSCGANDYALEEFLTSLEPKENWLDDL